MYMINRRGREDVIYWRCHRSRNSHCTGSITTGPGDAIISVKDTHNHPPDHASIYLPNYLFDCIMCMLVIIMYALPVSGL